LGGSLYAQHLCIDIPDSEWKCKGAKCDCMFEDKTGIQRQPFIERRFLAAPPFIFNALLTPDLECWLWKRGHSDFGSRAGRSRMIASPNGKYRAYVTVEA